ncbi:hypothetical protein HUJ05_009000 [Dendroctonus ponderosae]|nr:hypothetical protein HUJ05_009000 [Dendroctonus ponderosae]
MPNFRAIIPTEDGRFRCKKCGKAFLLKELTVSHVLYECGGVQPIIQCRLCPRKCKTADILQTHLKNIHGIKCGKSYKNPESLSRHKRECGREKSRQCPYCSHRSHRSDNLKRHMALHFCQGPDFIPFHAS